MKVWSKTQDGREIYSVTLTNRNGMEVTLISFGAAIQSIRVPDRQGVLRDVVLGFDTADEYVNDTESFGAVVGRSANRIGNARFMIDGKEYKIEANVGVNNLHSGKNGWQHRIWEVESETDDSVCFSIYSADMDQDFPGNMTAKITYRLNDLDELSLSYYAVTDAPTVCNITNHVYFNLDGHASGSIVDHCICIPADAFTPVHDDKCIPTGELRPVEGTPLDLRTTRRIREELESSYDQMIYGAGYDHNYAFGDTGVMKIMAIAQAAESGICMETRSDLPGIQFYIGNWIPTKPGKEGTTYTRRSGFCLETQYYPDAINQENFPGSVLRPGEEYKTTTIYRFYR